VLSAMATLMPVVSLPPNLPFGSVPQLTMSSSMTVTLTNTGNAALSFSSAPNVTGPNAADFPIVGGTCSVTTPVAANNGICTVILTFNPSTGGAENATLNFADNATPAMQTVPLSGTGIPPSVTFSTINPFGNQVVNTTSAAQTLTISVMANTGTLAFTSITITGTNAGDFAIPAAGTTCPQGAGMLVGGASCTVAITFTPGALGARSAALNIAGSDLPGSPKMIALSGMGTPPPAPAVTLAPTGLTFGVIPVGQNSMQNVTLTNTGNAGLTITSISISGPNMGDFSQTNNCPTPATGPLAAGGMCTIIVTFTPSAIQPESATLSITDNAANSPQTVALAGGGPGFTLSVPATSSGGSGSTITVLPGDTATYTLMLVCSPGVTGTITLMGMQPLPPNTILTITPSMVTCPSATPVTVMVMLQTNCVPSLVGPGPWGGGPLGVPLRILPGLLAALLLLGLGGKLVVQRQTMGTARLAPALVLLMAMVLPLCLAGCGVSNLPPALPNQPTTPAGTYPITLVGTGPTGAKVTLTLTVKVI